MSYSREIEEYSIRTLPSNERIGVDQVLELEDDDPKDCPSMTLELTDFLSDDWETSMFTNIRVYPYGAECPQKAEFERDIKEILMGKKENWHLVGLSLNTNNEVWLCYQYVDKETSAITFRNTVELRGLRHVSFMVGVPALAGCPDEQYVFEFDDSDETTRIYEQIGNTRRRITFNWNEDDSYYRTAQIEEYAGIV